MKFLQSLNRLRNRYQKKLVDFAASFVSSASYGLAVYVITLIFAFLYAPETVGQFRYVLSIFTILAAFTIVEANKVALKNYYKDASNYFPAALAIRFCTGTVIGAGAVAVFWLIPDRTTSLPVSTLMLSIAVLPFFSAFELYNFINFARKSYIANAIINVVKYSIICAVVFAVCRLWYADAQSAQQAIPYYFWAMSAANVLLFLAMLPLLGASGTWSRDFLFDSVRLSMGGIPQTIVENIDKVLVGAFFGATALGIYALNVSTGRLINTFVKPGLVVLYPYLTHNKVGLRTYMILLALASGIMLAVSPIVWLLFRRYMQPSYVDFIGLVFVSLAAFPLSLVYQIKLNEVLFGRDSIKLASQSSMFVGFVGLAVMAVAMALPETMALYVCAAALPLRYFAGTIMLFISDASHKE